jgi:hypothetical protein
MSSTILARANATNANWQTVAYIIPHVYFRLAGRQMFLALNSLRYFRKEKQNRSAFLVRLIAIKFIFLRYLACDEKPHKDITELV